MENNNEDKHIKDSMLIKFFSLNRKFHGVMCKLRHIDSTENLGRPEIFTMMKICQLARSEHEEEEPAEIGISMKKLAKEIESSPAMLTKTVNGLEKRGYVKRVSDEQDRRGVNVYITDTGLDIIKKQRKAHMDFVNSLAKRVGREKLEELMIMLEDVVNNANDLIDEIANKNSKGE